MSKALGKCILSVEVREKTKAALKIEALRQGKSVSELTDTLLAKALEIE